MPLAQALGRQLGATGISVLALPRAPQSLLHAVRQGRAAQREVGAQLFAANAIRKLRASVGEPTAVISAHRCARRRQWRRSAAVAVIAFRSARGGGLSLPALSARRPSTDVVAMLTDFLGECRVADVRVVPGVHDDRDPATGLPLLFKGDDRAGAAGRHALTGA